MPEWLLSFCVNICLLAGATVSILLFSVLVFVVSIEVWDFFHPQADVTDDEEYRY